MIIPNGLSLGVAHSFLSDGDFFMNKSSTATFNFILQNADDVTKEMVFRVETEFPMTIGDDELSYFEDTYKLLPNSNTPVKLEFHAPDFNSKFKIVHTHFEKSTGSGQIHIIQKTSGDFDVKVGDGNVYYTPIIPYEYDNYHLIFYGNDLYDVDLKIKSDNATIDFKDIVDLDDFYEDYVELEYNRIFINSEKLPDLNVSARITFNNLPYNYKPVIMKDNEICKDCDIVSYDDDDGVLVFDVEGFSEYTTEPSAIESSIISAQSDVNGDVNVDSIDVSDTDETSEISTESASSEEAVSDIVVESAVEDFIDNKLSDTSLASSVSESSLRSGNDLKDGAKRMISFLTVGFIALFASVGILLFYVKNHSMEFEKIIMKGDVDAR